MYSFFNKEELIKFLKIATTIFQERLNQFKNTMIELRILEIIESKQTSKPINIEDSGDNQRGAFTHQCHQLD